MRLCSIASGSSGNCIVIGSDNHHILIDVGISGKRITCGLEEIGVKPEEVDGIFIYATEKTIEAIKKMNNLGKIDESLYHSICPNEKIMVGDLQIEPIRIPHDAADPVMYAVRSGAKSAAVVTDLGNYNQYLIDKLQGLDVLLLEANHDIHMLEMGPYPYPLKQRILGENGHLSNEASGRFLNELLHDRFQGVMLGHLSKENNYEKLAYETVRLEVTLGDCPYRGSDFPIYVAKRDQVSDVLDF